MRHAISMYLRLIRVSIRSQMAYRTAFLLDLLATFIGTAFAFGTLFLIMERFGSIAGWTVPEIALLYGTAEAAFGIMDMVFGGFDPKAFGQQVRRGTFDQLLLRPINITVQVLGSEMTMRRIARILQGLLVLGYGLLFVDVAWTPLKAVYLPVIIISMTLFFAGLFIIGATITFWTVESIEIMNILTYGGTEMMSYPMNVYSDGLRRFFTYIVPTIFLNYYPVLFILDKADPFNMPAFASWLSPVVGVGMMLMALSFWNYGIRHYQSTGT